ncbi:MAG: sporulation protein YjcZ [Bacilli bacterium]|nr:sporulation protein YjcZ [Bacilli bacterium]
MYYYGNNGYYGNAGCNQGGYVGYTYGGGIGAAIWIVLFILLVIIIGAGWFGNNNSNNR